MRRSVLPALAIVTLTVTVAVSRWETPAPGPAPEMAHRWVASADSTQPDFLATLDVTEGSARFGRVIGTLPVPGRGNGPHHPEHELAPELQLFPNGFKAGWAPSPCATMRRG